MLYASRFARPRTLAATVCVLVSTWAGVSTAAPFTLAAPIAITGAEGGNPGVVGTMQPADLASLGQSIALSTGNVDFATTDVLVFSLSLSLGSSAVDGLGVGTLASPLLGNPVGAGSFVASGGGEQVPGSVSVGPFTTLSALFDFTPETLDAGETSVDLFVTYSPGGSALSEGSTVNFMVSSGPDFTVQGTLVQIPEPASALLLAGALVVLGLGGSGLGARRRARSGAQSNS